MASSRKRCDRAFERSELPAETSCIQDPALKLFAVRIFHVLQGPDFTQKKFRQVLAAAGYQVKESTFRTWIREFEATGCVGVPQKGSGAVSLLNSNQKAVMAGWVLTCNKTGTSVHLADYVTACLTIFEVEISEPTAARYLQQTGFSCHAVQLKATGFTLDQDVLERMLWDWVVKCRTDGFFAVPKSRIGSIDFTFTSHRKDQKTTFSPTKMGQPMSSDKIPIYTNCILTCVWRDGINRTPSVLFTFNPAFRTDRKETKIRSAGREKLQNALDTFGIAANRIVYVGAQKGESRKYVPEQPQLVRRFFGLYGVRKDTHLLSDRGHSFKENGESVLTKLGFKAHRTYPPPVHQYLSPNDNKLHGTAKAVWKEKCKAFDDDVESCCMLLSLLDQHTTEHSKRWFEGNMITLQESQVGQLIRGCTAETSRWYQQSLNLYGLSQGEDIREHLDQIPPNLRDTLDGMYFRPSSNSSRNRLGPREQEGKQTRKSSKKSKI